MKKIVCLCMLLLFLASSFAAKIPAEGYKDTLSATSAIATDTVVAMHSNVMAKAVRQLTTKGLGLALGRKLTLREKIGWFFLKKQIRHDEPTDADRRHANNNALLGFIFSIMGIFIFPLFAVPALILSASALRAEKANSGILTSTNRGLAVAGKIISIVDLVILIIVVGLLVVYFSTLGPW